MSRASALVVAALLLGCGKTPSPGESPPAASSSAPVASAPPAPSASAAPAAAPRAYRGTCKSVAATPPAPPGKGAKPPADPSTAGIGDSPLALTTDPATGRATGTLDGVLGPAVIEGTVAGATVTAAVRRKDPADRGFTGTLVGTLSGDHPSATLNMTPANAASPRTGSCDLTPSTAP